MTKIRLVMAVLLLAFAMGTVVSSSGVFADSHSNRCPTDNPGC